MTSTLISLAAGAACATLVWSGGHDPLHSLVAFAMAACGGYITLLLGGHT